MKPDVSVVVPLRNEAPNVLTLADRIFRAMDNGQRVVELIFVDDGSTDETWIRVLEAKNLDSRVRALRHSRNAGQSAALWTGFKACEAKVIATLDGDLQNDPADLPGMLAELENCDMVCGVRKKRRDNFVRRISSSVARIARKMVLGVDFRDSGCNLRVFKSSLLCDLIPFDGIHRFLPILAQATGAVIKELPVNHHPRTAGKSKYGICNRLGRGIVDLIALRWLLRRQLILPRVTEWPVPAPLSASHTKDTSVCSSGTGN